MNEYMITITFTDHDNDEFFSFIPQQRAMTNELMGKGVLTSYSLSADRGTLWMTMMAKSEARVMAILEKMPLFAWMEIKIEELMFHNAPVFAQPRFSVN